MNASPPTEPPEPDAGSGRGAVRRWSERIGLVPPAEGEDKWAHRRGEPRGFAVLWMAYLLASTLVVFMSLGDPVRVTAEGYREGVRMLITAIAIGISVMWPMLRLSQASPAGGGGGAVARDLMILLIPLQAVLWPQAVLTGWTLSAIGATALTLLAWAMLIGAMVAAGLGYGQPMRDGQSGLQERDESGETVTVARTLWMLAIIVLVLIGPILSVLLRSFGRSGSADLQVLLGLSSPLTAPWELLRDRVWTGHRAVVGAEHWRVAWMLLSVAVAAWILRGLWHRGARV